MLKAKSVELRCKQKIDKMERTALSLALMFFLAGSSAFFAEGKLVRAKTGTQVGGIIASNTTWTRAGSPYNLTGDILVN